MVRWVVGSLRLIPNGGVIELFLAPATAPRMVMVCAILSVVLCL